METPSKYRFTLQWGSGNEEKIQVGELLKSLGNRKSEFIVMALAEYLKSHPEFSSPGQKLKIIVKPEITREQIETMVNAAVNERLAGIRTTSRDDISVETIARADDDVNEMIKNLEMFG